MTQIRLDETFHYEFDDTDYHEFLPTDEFELISVDDANVGWSNDYDYPFNFPINGYCRGINLEFTKDGKISYASADFVYGDITCDNVRSTIELAGYNGWTPTGRAIFRGYYTDHYDAYEREWFVEPVNPNELRRTI